MTKCVEVTEKEYAVAAQDLEFAANNYRMALLLHTIKPAQMESLAIGVEMKKQYLESITACFTK